MTMEVNGKVVRIISKSEVIIDIGRDAHVEVGDKVEIIVVGDKITDDNGRSLGYFTFQKTPSKLHILNPRLLSHRKYTLNTLQVHMPTFFHR